MMETSALKSFLLQLREFITRSYEEDMAAIDRVLGIAGEHSSPVPTDRTLPLPLEETPRHQEPQVDDASSLIDAVEDIFRSDPHKAWNVKTLHRKLVASGFAFQSKNPKSSINTALSRLLNKRLSILIIQHGSGRRPTQYKLVPFAKEQNANGRVSDMR